MGDGNQRAKAKLMKQFGKICMVEESGIRRIPKAVRMKIKGYKKTDDMITFHHLVPRRKGGKATPENGALVKDYNHRWLESLPSEDRERVNDKLREYKLNFSQISVGEKGLQVEQNGSIQLDFGGIDNGDCIIIPVYDNKGRHKDRKKEKPKTRAKLKEELRQQVDSYMTRDNDDDYSWER